MKWCLTYSNVIMIVLQHYEIAQWTTIGPLGVWGTLEKNCFKLQNLKFSSKLNQAGDTRIPLPRKSLWTQQKNCRLQSWTLYKSADCRWASTTILCGSFTNSATVGRLKQVQLCNRLIDQSADNTTGLKSAKECLILKYKYIQNPWLNTLMLGLIFCARLKCFNCARKSMTNSASLGEIKDSGYTYTSG